MTYYYHKDPDDTLNKIGEEDALKDFWSVIKRDAKEPEEVRVYEVPEPLDGEPTLSDAFAAGGKCVKLKGTVQAIKEA